LWALAPQVPAFSGQPAALHRTPPTASPVVTDPLDALAQLRDGTAGSPARPVLSVDTSAPSSGYLTLAVLDSYDGGSWRFDATFHPTGGRIPGAAASLGTTEVRQQIEELAALPVPLLPELDRPRFVSGPAVATDPATGMLVPESHTVVGTPYTVVSESPGSTLTQLPAADELGGSAATAADELGGSAAPADTTLPPDTTPAVATTVRFLAALTGMRPAPTVAFLDAAISALHQSTRRIDPRLAPANPTGGQPSHLGGTSLSEVINAVTVNRAATPEQFATFAAMAARYLGVPARVVTGFRIPATSSGHLVPAGRYRVTNRQAWAWIEVPVAGLGWVVADPTPDVTTGAATPPPEAVQAPATTLPPRQANAVPRASILGGHALAPSARVRVPHPHPVPLWLVVGLIAIAAVLAGLAAGPGQAAARRWGRRRARRSADPSELAVGAWLELLDGLSRAGLRPEPGSTGRDVAAEAAGSFGPDLRDPVAEVGRVAEQAVFSVSRPPDADAALRAWDLQQSVGRQLRRGLSRRDRVRASVLVGSTPRRPAGR
jgi:transglutaminase-like putative cysteine protease